MPQSDSLDHPPPPDAERLRTSPTIAGLHIGTLVVIALFAVAVWALSRPASELARTRGQFAELQRQVGLARQGAVPRANDRRQLLRLQAQSRTAGDVSSREAFDRAAAAIESRLGGDDQPTLRAAVLDRPLLSLARAAAPQGVMPVFGKAGNGCAVCHVAIASPGFESYPVPFRTHPNLSQYVGAASPHDPSRFACASCHRGDGSAVTFAGAGHARLARDGVQQTSSRQWVDASAERAMLPVGRLEAGCVACHQGERSQPAAPRLDDGLVTLERGGCYSCHDIAGMSADRRRGPDLRRISAKLSPAWTRHWLADPRAVKPATWMPRFWTDPSSEEQGAEIDAVVAYLFANADEYRPATLVPPRGDAVRGQTIVESVGCLGCHVVGDAVRDTTSLRRTFGQPLQATGSKTTYAWLYDWVRQPSRYAPATRMPDLRLTDAEAADVATYLESLSTGSLEHASTTVVAGDDVYREMIRPSAASRPAVATEAAALTGEALRVLAGREVIRAVGCFNCHEIRGFDSSVPKPVIPARRIWSDADAGAIHGRAGQGSAAGSAEPPELRVGNYAFGSTERQRLALALTAVAGPIADGHPIQVPWHLREVAGRALVQERNCIGCHTIEGAGGDLSRLVSEPSLGPPLLTPEGSRVQRDWLRHFLREPRAIRPWLSARMPTFGWTDEDLDRVTGYFGEIAQPNPKPTSAPPGVTAAVGRELFDLLKCQQCHVLGAIPTDQPTSNLAPDLRIAHERLQPEWILAWLENPSAILPGTRMPSFWPDYPKSFYPPLDGNGASQTRAIRDHVMALREGQEGKGRTGR